MEAVGRIHQLRVINPLRPDISASYNPFWSEDGNYEDHISFIFESFKMEKDFFEGHQRVYLENIARILHYTGKRFNFHDVLVAAYDQAILEQQIKLAVERTRSEQSDPVRPGKHAISPRGLSVMEPRIAFCFSRRVRANAPVDVVLTCLSCEEHGRIFFDSEWRSRGVRLLAASVFRDKQESLLLLPWNGWGKTNQGEWRCLWTGSTATLTKTTDSGL